eukprot:g4021.t1
MSAATRIQALVRGRTTRRRLLEDMKRRETSCVRIQAIYRGHSSRMDLRRRTTKKRLLVTLFAEALEVSAARSNNEDAKSEENWGTIDGVQLRKVVTASFVSMFFPKHAKAIATMAVRLSKHISNRPINCGDFVRAGLDVLSRSG